jgi:hypothetical protein
MSDIINSAKFARLNLAFSVTNPGERCFAPTEINDAV